MADESTNLALPSPHYSKIFKKGTTCKNMRSAQQHNPGIWETDGQVVAALADLGRLNPQPVVGKSRKAI